MDWFDTSLYPEFDAETLSMPYSIDEQIDFVARVCGAWDFGVLPLPETLIELRKLEWREAVNKCELLASPTYHLLRRWHDLPSLPFLGSVPAYITTDPYLEYV